MLMDHSHKHQWSDLLPELISAISNSLTSNPFDILSFRSVCNSWRSSCTPLSHPSLLSPPLPLSIPRPFPPVHNLPHSSTDSTLSVTVIYSLLRPVDSGLLPETSVLFVDEYHSGKLKIRQPFSTGSYSVPIFFPVNVNLFDFDAREIGRFYNLSYSYYYDDKRGTVVNKPFFRPEDVINVLKVVLFPNGSAVVAVFDGGILGLVRLDDGISEWDLIHGGKGFQFDDVVDYKGKVLGVDRGGKVYEIGHSEINVFVRSSSIARGSGWRKRLVESLGFLYLVVRYDDSSENDERTALKVYELNAERKKWVAINNIGDRVFFFGIDFSFSASAQQVSWGKNCILFKKNSFRSYGGDQNDGREFYHSVSSPLSIDVCYLKDAIRVGAIATYSVYSDTFWPPPAWIWPIDRLQRMVTVDAAINEIFVKMYEKFKIKYQELFVEEFGASFEDFHRLGGAWPEFINRDNGFEIWVELQLLKKTLNELTEVELYLTNLEKLLQLPFNGNNLSTDTDMLNHEMGRLPVSAQTSSLVGTEDRCDHLDKIERATEYPTIDRHMIWYNRRKMYATIFETEERVSDLVCHFHSCHRLAEELQSAHDISNA